MNSLFEFKYFYILYLMFFHKLNRKKNCKKKIDMNLYVKFVLWKKILLHWIKNISTINLVYNTQFFNSLIYYFCFFFVVDKQHFFIFYKKSLVLFSKTSLKISFLTFNFTFLS